MTKNHSQTLEMLTSDPSCHRMRCLCISLSKIHFLICDLSFPLTHTGPKADKMRDFLYVHVRVCAAGKLIALGFSVSPGQL